MLDNDVATTIGQRFASAAKLLEHTVCFKVAGERPNTVSKHSNDDDMHEMTVNMMNMTAMA